MRSTNWVWVFAVGLSVFACKAMDSGSQIKDDAPGGTASAVPQAQTPAVDPKTLDVCGQPLSQDLLTEAANAGIDPRLPCVPCHSTKGKQSPTFGTDFNPLIAAQWASLPVDDKNTITKPGAGLDMDRAVLLCNVITKLEQPSYFNPMPPPDSANSHVISKACRLKLLQDLTTLEASLPYPFGGTCPIPNPAVLPDG